MVKISKRSFFIAIATQKVFLSRYILQSLALFSLAPPRYAHRNAICVLHGHAKMLLPNMGHSRHRILVGVLFPVAMPWHEVFSVGPLASSCRRYDSRALAIGLACTPENCLLNATLIYSIRMQFAHFKRFGLRSIQLGFPGTMSPFITGIRNANGRRSDRDVREGGWGGGGGRDAKTIE